MATEYNTTRNNYTALWWTLGAIAVLFILWFAFFHNRNTGIPNTGTDNMASSTGLYDSTNTTDNSAGNTTDNTNPGSPAITDQSKG